MPSLRTFLTLALVYLVASPLAAASGWGGTAIEVATPREGDRLSYSQTIAAEGADAVGTWMGVPYEGAGEMLVVVGGTSTIEDGFGRERPAQAYAIQQAGEGQLVRDETCYAEIGASYAIRREFAASAPDFTWSANTGLSVDGMSVTGGMVTKEWAPILRFDGRACEGALPWAGQTLREGERMGLWWTTFAYGLPQWGLALQSEPARATSFAGRDALEFRFDAADAGLPMTGALSLTLADGLPGIALVETDVTAEIASGTRRVASRTELVGLERGDGAPVSTDAGRIRPQPTVGTTAPYTRLGLDDAALGLAFPFDEALDAAIADPRVGLGAWLDEHPDAHVAIAIHERHMDEERATGTRSAPLGLQETDGGWYVSFADGEDEKAVVVYRMSGATAGGVASALPAKITRVLDARTGVAAQPDVLPTSRITSAAMVERLAQVGVDAAGMESFVWDLGGYGASSYLNVFASDVSYMSAPDRATGLFVSLDGKTGSLHSLATTTYRATPLRLPMGVGGVERAGGAAQAAEALGGPVGGIAIGAVGLLALALLVKLLLLPLYSRLRRDALLDNPVRARLYERIRAEPGIHLEALVDFVGMGNGATRHHVEQLVRHHYAVEVEVDGRARYYAAGELTPQEARLAAALRSPAAKAVYDLYAAEPSLPLREAARRIGSSAPAVHRVKKRLEKEGLLPAAPVAQVGEA